MKMKFNFIDEDKYDMIIIKCVKNKYDNMRFLINICFWFFEFFVYIDVVG